MDARGTASRILGVSVLGAGLVLFGGVAFLAGRGSTASEAPPLVAVPEAAPLPAPPPPPPPPTEAELLLARMRDEARAFAALDGRALDDALLTWAADAADVSYASLERNPTAHFGERVVFSGRVLEIRDLPEGGAFLRLGTGSYGSDPLWIETFERPSEEIVTDRRVRAYGYLAGPHTYTSEAGWNITIPSMLGVAVVRRTDR